MCSKIRNGADVHINAGGVYRVGLKTQPESKCPELLANYCDMLLRKTPLSKKLTSEEIEAKLKEVVRPSCHRSFSQIVHYYIGEILQRLYNKVGKTLMK